MIVVMRPHSRPEEISAVEETIRSFGFAVHRSEGVEKTVLGIIGEGSKEEVGEAVQLMDGVDRAIPILAPYKLASRHFRDEPTVIWAKDVPIGSDLFVVMAGPCSVESEEQILQSAMGIKKAGAQVLRGGAFKPRTSPYGFQGLKEDGLKMLDAARNATGLLIDTEVLDPRDVELVAGYADILQIGTRNMQNYPLLKEVGGTQLPVILKRSQHATYEEWLMAAEYILSAGNPNVILCERGIRTFETYTRNTLDLNAVPAAKQLTHLPVIIDPSHGTGRWELVSPMARAAMACGADGLLIEVHPDPKHAKTDGLQSLSLENFATLMGQLRAMAPVLDRKL